MMTDIEFRPMKFLVLGSNGMAGHLISLYLQERNHDVTGFAREKSKVLDKSILGDATDFTFLAKIIKYEKYDVVINCIGLLNQFAENSHDKAVALNSYLPHFLAATTRTMPTKIFQMSTDCVFSGRRGQYTEHDEPDGTTFYDRSKALGELNDDKNLTLRNSIVGPDIKPTGIGLMNWFLQQDGEIRGFTGAMWTGQTTLQLAKTMEAAAMQGASGLINAVPDQSISKYDLLRLFNKYMRGHQVKINPVIGISADKSLKRTNFSFDYHIPGYETMVREAALWIRQHEHLYPQYKKISTQDYE